MLSKLGDKHNDKVGKLIPNLVKKERYVVHSKSLEYYNSKRFGCQQDPPCDPVCSEALVKPLHRLHQAKNDFEKDFFKLMNNAVFGKTMGNVRARVDYKFSTTKKSF